MILEAENIHKSFPPLVVLRGLSLQLNKGETLAIMGKSGEGKSTLLHILGTLETPTSGTIRICGKIPSKQDIAAVRNRHIGFIFQFYHLLEDFSVLDNVLMPLRIGRLETSASEKGGMLLLKEMGLEGKEKLQAKFLSGGEKQRVAIARALCNQPDLLLADEPTGNLDQGHSQEIQNILLTSARKYDKALIVVTHDQEFAKKCDRILFLRDGRLYE